MDYLLGLGALVVALVFGFLGVRIGATDSARRTRKLVEEVERQRKEQAAKEAGEAMRAAAAERDAALKRPAATVVGDAMRRGR
jgi:mevalonate kinase